MRCTHSCKSTAALTIGLLLLFMGFAYSPAFAWECTMNQYNCETLDTRVTALENRPAGQGRTGPQGVPGRQGERGVQGVPGERGMTGPQGVPGIDVSDKLIKASIASAMALAITPEANSLKSVNFGMAEYDGEHGVAVKYREVNGDSVFQVGVTHNDHESGVAVGVGWKIP